MCVRRSAPLIPFGPRLFTVRGFQKNQGRYFHPALSYMLFKQSISANVAGLPLPMALQSPR
jgi:hypothetical protein